jgi:cell division protein FtsB
LPARRRHNPGVRRILVFGTCVLMLDALFGDRGLAETRRARRTFQQAEETVKRMKHENAGLREQIRRLKDDPGTIESVARAELGLIKPGEILVVVKDVK